jgi:hypothetical protein
MNTSPIRRRLRFGSRLPHRFAGVLAVTLTVSTAYTRPAHAVPVVEIIGFMTAAYEAYKALAEIIGGEGPNLSNQLAQVQASILNELRTQRNQQLRATAEAGMNDFRTLTFRQPSDPANQGTWQVARQRMTDALTHYSIIVEDGTDRTSSYELAPLYFTLVTTYAGLLQMKPEIGMAPSAWEEYYRYLQRAMNVGYKLVGAHIAACWAGFNPGRDGYNWSYPNTDFTKAYSTSQLFRHVTWNKRYPAGEVTFTGCFTIPPTPIYSVCSPTDFTCLDDCGNWFVAENQQRRNAAIESADWIDFGTNPTVGIVRAAMRQMQKVGGGNEPADFPRIDLPEDHGMFVDPWVTEESCRAVSGGPWAYPITP